MKQFNTIFVICFTITMIVGVIVGVFLWFVPKWLFSSLLIATAAAFTALLWGSVIAVWNWASRLNLIFPDENGNYPIKMMRRFVIGWRGIGIETTPINLNLTGASTYKEWATWQVTNNHRASQPRELLEQVEPRPEMRLIAGPGQSMVIDAVAQEL